MTGYVTESRFIPVSGSVYSKNNVSNRSYPVDIRSSVYQFPVQTTTSFRTSRRETSGTDPVEDQLLSGGSWASSVKKISSSRSYETNQQDNGHTFSTVKQSITLGGLVVSWAPTSSVISGPAILNFPVAADRGYASLPSVDSSYYGPIAISRTRPTNPTVNLAVALTELIKDGLPDIPGASLRSGITPRNLGSEYLNKEFGIDPLIADIRDTLKAVKRSKALVSSFVSNSGKNVRRSFSFAPVRTTSGYSSIAGVTLRFGAIPTNALHNLSFFFSDIGIDPRVTVIRQTRTLSEVYFRGAFTYTAWSGDDLVSQMKGFEQKANRLFGVRLTPATLWQVGPWSWLVDWKLNIGANISNAEALSNDNLVLRYGYLMIRRESHIDYSWTTVNPQRNGGPRLSGTQTHSVISKERVRATPYGFGSNPASFTDRQWAILGALGMTKAPKSLF